MTKKSLFKTSQNRLVYFELEYKENTEVIVFLNGLSDSIENWGPAKDYLQDRFTTLFIDLIGQGAALDEELKKAEDEEN